MPFYTNCLKILMRGVNNYEAEQKTSGTDNKYNFDRNVSIGYHINGVRG